jgi:peptidoglycan/LPS O-acetylase OafA/YrhL
MTNALSVYLDALRFGAAFVVFVSHYVAERYTGGLFWQAMPYGRTAVLVFFVLSGFVIAWVTETRERTLEDYTLSRLARLYSVIVPVFVVTAILDGLGMAIDPANYGPESHLSLTQALLGYGLSAVFLGESWTLNVVPGSDIPYWSLNYEAWYYVLFAAAVFLQGGRRIAALVTAALLAGPKILILFPTWLMGVAAWRWRASFPAQRGARLCVFGPVAVFAALEALGGQQLFRHAETPWLPFMYSPYDYLVSALVALFIMGLANMRLTEPRLAVVRAIRWLAGTSFGLYLLHRPLLDFFGTVIPGPTHGAIHRTLLFGFALGGSLGLAHLTERRKGSLKSWLRSGLDAIRREPRQAALERQNLS